MRPVLPQLAFLLTLRSDLRHGGSTHHSTDLLTGWPTLNCTALSKAISLHPRSRRNALKPQMSFGSSITNWDFAHGHDWYREKLNISTNETTSVP